MMKRKLKWKMVKIASGGKIGYDEIILFFYLLFSPRFLLVA
jgi:hypothetical protein